LIIIEYFYAKKLKLIIKKHMTRYVI